MAYLVSDVPLDLKYAISWFRCTYKTFLNSGVQSLSQYIGMLVFTQKEICQHLCNKLCYCAVLSRTFVCIITLHTSIIQCHPETKLTCANDYKGSDTNQSGLTTPLSRHSVGTYLETSSHATCQGTLSHSCLSSQSHCGLILA